MFVTRYIQFNQERAPIVDNDVDWAFADLAGELNKHPELRNKRVISHSSFLFRDGIYISVMVEEE